MSKDRFEEILKNFTIRNTHTKKYILLRGNVYTKKEVEEVVESLEDLLYDLKKNIEDMEYD